MTPQSLRCICIMKNHRPVAKSHSPTCLSSLQFYLHFSCRPPIVTLTSNWQSFAHSLPHRPRPLPFHPTIGAAELEIIKLHTNHATTQQFHSEVSSFGVSVSCSAIPFAFPPPHVASCSVACNNSVTVSVLLSQSHTDTIPYHTQRGKTADFDRCRNAPNNSWILSTCNYLPLLLQFQIMDYHEKDRRLCMCDACRFIRPPSLYRAQ